MIQMNEEELFSFCSKLISKIMEQERVRHREERSRLIATINALCDHSSQYEALDGPRCRKCGMLVAIMKSV